LAKQAFVYQDPVSGLVLVTGTLTIVVTDAAMSMNFIASKDLNVRRANVQASYTFRNRDYTVAMDTLRTADQ